MSDSEVQKSKRELRLLQDQVAALQLRVSELEGYEVVSFPAGYSAPVTSDSQGPPRAADPAPATSQTTELFGAHSGGDR